MDNAGQAVQCRDCGMMQEIRADMEIKDYQCPTCWHRHRAGKESRRDEQSCELFIGGIL